MSRRKSPRWNRGRAPAQPQGVFLAPAGQSVKLGISTQDYDASRTFNAQQESDIIASLRAKWWYNYLPYSQDTSPINGAVFVPNFFKGSYVTAANLAVASKYQSQCILTSNEPYNVPPQANELVGTVLAYWHQFELTGCRLGSPSGGVGTAWDVWLPNFLGGTVPETGQPPRVDFLVVHAYQSRALSASTAASNIITQLQNLFSTYGKPIWVTEFAQGSGSPNQWATSSQEAQFFQALIPQLQALPYVERFAAYPTRYTVDEIVVDPGSVAVSLANADGTLTSPVGTTYRDLG